MLIILDYLKDIFTDEAIREMYPVDPDNIYDDVSRMNRGFIVWESVDLDMVASFILWTWSA